MTRGFRRMRRILGRSAMRIFYLDDFLKRGMRLRILDRYIEEGYRNLGDFIYSHHQEGALKEGDLTLLDLMRTELARLSEERKGLGWFKGQGKKGADNRDGEGQ